jgi:hypothetical protein
VALHPIKRGTDFFAPAYHRGPPVILGPQELLLLDEGLDELEDDARDELLVALTALPAEELDGSSSITVPLELLLPHDVEGIPSPVPASPAMVMPIATSTGPMWLATPRFFVPRSAPHRSPTTFPSLLTMTEPESP